MHRRLVLSLTLSVTAAIPSVLPAQVPPHTAIVGTLNLPPLPVRQTGTSGLFLVPLPTPSRSGVRTPIPVTGLPTDLTVPHGSFGGT